MKMHFLMRAAPRRTIEQIKLSYQLLAKMASTPANYSMNRACGMKPAHSSRLRIWKSAEK